MTAANTRLQLQVPGHLRGRVMGIYILLFIGMTPIGSYLCGQLAEQRGREGHGADHGRAVRRRGSRRMGLRPAGRPAAEDGSGAELGAFRLGGKDLAFEPGGL